MKVTATIIQTNRVIYTLKKSTGNETTPSQVTRSSYWNSMFIRQTRNQKQQDWLKTEQTGIYMDISAELSWATTGTE